MIKAIATTGIIASALTVVLVTTNLNRPGGVSNAVAAAADPSVGAPRIQIALLLDTSNSMDGLIGQARTQLWQVVNEYARASRNGKPASLEIALYEYGNSRLAADAGYIRQVLPFTGDLDRVSEKLFELTTAGGDEYCGEVIERAASELDWSTKPDDLKLVFIAGNEEFDQGPIDFRKAIPAAQRKGIHVNAIRCDSDNDRTWREAATLARAALLTLDQEKRAVHIDAPQDDEISRLGLALNDTYLPYGSDGYQGFARQAAQDRNASNDRDALLARSVAKANGLYGNSSWDLVDATRGGHGVDLAGLCDDELPAAMRGLDAAGRRAYVAGKAAERDRLQSRINELEAARRRFVDAELARQGGSTPEATLGAQLIRVAHAQGAAAGLRF
jgi:hypothetical protein